MRPKILPLAFLFVFPATLVWAVEGDTLWTRHLGGDYHQVAYAVSASGDGGCVTAGYASHEYAGAWNMYAIRFTSSGDTAWTGEYGSLDSFEEAHSICPSGDGGFMLAGNTNAYAYWSDMYLVKINNTGSAQWTGHYGGDYHEVAYCVCPAGDEGFLLAGETGSFPYGLHLVKVNSAGAVQWSRSYGFADEMAYDAVLTADGGFMVVGYSDRYSSYNSDVFLLRINSGGDTAWTKTFGGDETDIATAVCLSGDGGYMIAGYTASFGAGSWDMFLIKVAENGDTLWTRTYGGTSFDQAWAIIPSNDGNFLLAGHTGSYGAGDADMYLVKVDPSGNPLWSRTYGGTDEDRIEDLCASGDGDYYLAGKTASFTTPAYYDVYLVKIEGTLVAVIPENSAPRPTAFELHPCIPNPFNATTVLSYEFRVTSHVSLKVYNTAGRLVTTLVEGWRDAGTHAVTFDGSKLASGIYLYRLEAEGQTLTGKMVLLK
jgi:hypothetical protein